ncbi:hypothetical protein CDD82_2148 [Ophiocordyceps australis]|uniref:Uncharacterized protein n=1 Tax=Ophiocordyceps australis TaxID=1399860 RepID=A0A2C5XYA5_9HYPO|nr:hypothetical protein CDD82_2148 [Ophiocordyceps australis]
MLRHQDSASSLQSAGTATSRFTKALPSLPGYNETPAHMPRQLLKDLPQLPQLLSPSPSPPLKDNGNSRTLKATCSITRKPVNASTATWTAPSGQSGRPTPPPKPLPSLQLLPPPPPSSLYPTPPSSSTPTSGHKVLPLSLPRRPVGSGRQQNSMKQLPTPGHSSASWPGYELGEPSPTDTLSSLLSAYSREPDDQDVPRKGSQTTKSPMMLSPSVGTSLAGCDQEDANAASDAGTDAGAADKPSKPQCHNG